MVRRLSALVGLVVVFATMTASRADEANRECDNNQDVSVVVDFAHLGGGVNVRCAPQGADGIQTGFDALEHANISYEASGGFLCRIAGRPESTDCTNRPGTGPYWAYWYAKRGGEWKYSNQGAGARKPPPGSFEGWSYADDGGSADPPRYPVPPPLAASATTATTATAPDDSAGPSVTGATATTRARGPAPTARPPAATTTLAPTVGAAVEAAPPAPATSTSVELGSVDLSVGGGGGGTSGGFLASVGAVAAVATIAFVLLRLRAR